VDTHDPRNPPSRLLPAHLPPQRRAYRLASWEDSHDFLTQLARATGKLLKGGDADLNTAARMVLYDWQRGKVPFYTLPPGYADEAPPKAGGAGAAAAAAAAAAAQQQQQQQQQEGEGTEGGPGIYIEGVTEEDAAAEAGARPETAAAAARAMREAAAAALQAQRRGRMPIKEGYYLPGDEQAEEGGEEGGSEEGFGASEEEDEDEEPGSGAGAEEGSSSGEEAGGSSGSEEEEEAEEDGGEGRSGSGDESDGYGEEGLSWEAVLQAVQVGGLGARRRAGPREAARADGPQGLRSLVNSLIRPGACIEIPRMNFHFVRLAHASPVCVPSVCVACMPSRSSSPAVAPRAVAALPSAKLVGKDAHVSFGVEASLTNTKSRADNPYHYP
jgi:hypothetical protein